MTLLKSLLFALLIFGGVNQAYASKKIANKKKMTKVAATFDLKLGKAEVVPSKVEKIMVNVVSKDVHGKETTRQVEKVINKKMDLMKNKRALAYFEDVKKHILAHKVLSLKINKKDKNKKLKGEVSCKIQIQKDGRYDILFLGGIDPNLTELAHLAFDKIKRFPPIPSSLEQQEIQLKIPMLYKLTK